MYVKILRQNCLINPMIMSKLQTAFNKLIRTLNGVFVKLLNGNVKANVEEVSKNMQKVQKEIIYKKAGELNSWYTRVLGLDEVKKYQERVATLQEKLLDAQERRRSIGYQLSDIRTESNAVQDQIHKVNRQEAFEIFLDLMRKETEILKKEREIAKQFNDCDQEEREIFTAYTSSVKDSHEKQRAQLEYTKYFGLILSLVGSFLAFCYSTLRKQDLKRFVEKQLTFSTGSTQDIVSRLKENDARWIALVNYIKRNEATSYSINSPESTPIVIAKADVLLAVFILFVALKLF